MSAVLWPGAEVRAVAAAVTTPLRRINVGLIGLGQVGQAVARLIPEAARLKDSGLRFRIAGALVRDLNRPRRCPKPTRLTTNPAAFLRGNYDVVIEALGDAEPARTLVARLLGRGIAVVTANKALVAAHGAELSAMAARRGTSFRYEASALAGVPFLGALAARPLVSDVQHFTAIVNGTSNFILSTIAAEACGFDAALDEARARGLTEPDPSRDLDGIDAANKLSLLAGLFGWGGLDAAQLDRQGIRDLGVADLQAARSLGATIKPLVHASRDGDAVSAYIGPALVPLDHPLASLGGTLSGIQLSGRFVSDLFFSGPGAGPDITAATIVDDAVEAVTTAPVLPRTQRRPPASVRLTSPQTRWFVSARFPGLTPDPASTERVFASHGLTVIDVTTSGDRHWLRVGSASREHVARSLAAIHETHRVETHAIRAL
jgi:homoserine dehydrogenase